MIKIYLDLDSGATVSYAILSSDFAHGFIIKPNSNLSNLADGKNKITFYWRNCYIEIVADLALTCIIEIVRN